MEVLCAHTVVNAVEPSPQVAENEVDDRHERLEHLGVPVPCRLTPCGYGLYRQLTGLGCTCRIVAPSRTPKTPGERIKNDVRDAEKLARLCRAGELTFVWVPDTVHEAMRDLVRARYLAAKDVRHARAHVQMFLLN